MTSFLATITRMNWERGLTRIYLVLVAWWFGDWIFGVPFRAAEASDDFWPTYFRVLGTLFTDPFALGLVLLIPLIGYLVFRIAFAVILWVMRGFRSGGAA